ncbi:MAG TPA: riboflavin synthase [Candidatus Peribacteraceae bacterium]|nr:riboflavin synthase [Candidatus Peribacteraceae bacterium]
MFTGIIETTAEVLRKSDHSLTIQRPAVIDDIRMGSSISISGVCLSVVEFDTHSMTFDVVDETLTRTTLGALKTGDTVNLERSMRADGRFEGHIVQGHVEGTGKVTSLKPQASGMEMTIELPDHLLPLVVEKGSIAVDGVSLTVAKLNGNMCTIAVIPHTLSMTTLGHKKEGDRVNIETDILARYSLRSA